MIQGKLNFFLLAMNLFALSACGVVEMERESALAQASQASGSGNSSYWLISTLDGDTFLTRTTAGNVGERAIDWCTVYPGSTLYLAKPPVREGRFLKVRLLRPMPGCPLSSEDAYLYEDHIKDGFGEFGFKTFVNPEFKQKLEAIFQQGSGKNTIWSVDIRASNHWSHERYIMYQKNPYTAVKPASNMKLMTTWAAFERVPEVKNVESWQFNKLRNMMKDSNNSEAEAILGWVGGRASVRALFEEKGFIPSPGFRIADGSGLSYDNRLSATDLIQVLLYTVRHSGYVPQWRATLPVGGLDGTLSSRLARVPGSVAAKTGTLNQTTALSGIADAKNTDWQVVFSILGDFVPSVDHGRNTIDRAVTEILAQINYL